VRGSELNLMGTNTYLKITAICVVIPLEEGFDSNRNEIRWVADSKGGCMRRKFH
jgi:hypothetical protein